MFFSYYQGYNDVAATVLLVMGLQKGLRVLEKISLKFLERFMEKTLEKVNQELFYIFALLDREHPKLLEHLEKYVTFLIDKILQKISPVTFLCKIKF